jgi:hypothetical protein
MESKNYHCSIAADISAKKAMDLICDVRAWWSDDLEGSAEKVNDVFTVRFGETFITLQVEELSDKKIVWLVTDSYKHWVKGNKYEWNGTRIVWDISFEGKSTKIEFTHVGLVPGLECYGGCEDGWNFLLKSSLLKLMSEGKGSPYIPKINEQLK